MTLLKSRTSSVWLRVRFPSVVYKGKAADGAAVEWNPAEVKVMLFPSPVLLHKAEIYVSERSGRRTWQPNQPQVQGFGFCQDWEPRTEARLSLTTQQSSSGGGGNWTFWNESLYHSLYFLITCANRLKDDIIPNSSVKTDRRWKRCDKPPSAGDCVWLCAHVCACRWCTYDLLSSPFYELVPK